MLFGFLLIVHVIMSIILIVIILIQGGRGGLGEALGGAAAQSVFGGGASNVMTKVTATAAGLFMVTCLVLAKLSTIRGGSVIDQNLPIAAPESFPGIIPGEPVDPSVPAGGDMSPKSSVPSPSPNETGAAE